MNLFLPCKNETFYMCCRFKVITVIVARFNIHALTEQVTVVREKSDGINASLCERRERIEELNGTRGLLRKVQVNLCL